MNKVASMQERQLAASKNHVERSEDTGIRRFAGETYKALQSLGYSGLPPLNQDTALEEWIIRVVHCGETQALQKWAAPTPHPPNDSIDLDQHVPKIDELGRELVDFVVKRNLSGNLKFGCDPRSGDTLGVFEYITARLEKYKEYLGETFSDLLQVWIADARQKCDSQEAFEVVIFEECISIPSAEHASRNDDRVVTGQLRGHGRFTVVADGISSAKSPVAAKKSSEGLKAFWINYDWDSGFNPTNEAHLEELRSIYIHALRLCVQSETDWESATTVETALEIIFQGKLYLLTLSIGDSQTIVINPAEDKCYRMNLCANYKGVPGDHIEISDTPGAGRIPWVNKPISNTVGEVDCEGNLYHGNCDQGEEQAFMCAVTVKPLHFDDVYIVASDGLTDISVLPGTRGFDFAFDHSPFLDRMLLAISRLGGLTNLEKTELALCLSVAISSKADDASGLFVTPGILV